MRDITNNLFLNFDKLFDSSGVFYHSYDPEENLASLTIDMYDHKLEKDFTIDVELRSEFVSAYRELCDNELEVFENIEIKTTDEIVVYLIKNGIIDLESQIIKSNIFIYNFNGVYKFVKYKGLDIKRQNKIFEIIFPDDEEINCIIRNVKDENHFTPFVDFTDIDKLMDD